MSVTDYTHHESTMRPFIALATLAATATYVYAQRTDGTAGGKNVAPAPGDKPAHDPSSGFSSFVAQGAVPRRNCPPSAQDPYPAQGVPRQDRSGGHVEIYPYEAPGSDRQQPFPAEVPDYCQDASEIKNGGGPGWVPKGKSLADTLTLDRRARVWWDYAREIDSVVRLPCSRDRIRWVGR